MRVVGLNFKDGRKMYGEIKHVSLCTPEAGFCLEIDESIEIPSQNRSFTRIEISVVSGKVMLGDFASDWVMLDDSDGMWLLDQYIHWMGWENYMNNL